MSQRQSFLSTPPNPQKCLCSQSHQSGCGKLWSWTWHCPGRENSRGGLGICEYMQNLLMKCKCQFLEVGWFWTLIPIFTSLYWNFIAIISCFNDTLRSHTYISGDDIHCKSQCTLMHQNFTFKTLHNNQSPNHSTS